MRLPTTFQISSCLQVVQAGPLKVRGITGYWAATAVPPDLTPVYLHIFDSITLPQALDEPLVVVALAHADNFSVDLFGVTFSKGVTMGISDIALNYNQSTVGTARGTLIVET